jgi:flagellar hook-associated protein 1 FlgK
VFRSPSIKESIMAGLLSIGLTGLNASQANLLTTSHNITNAATPGYNRQTVSLTTNDPQFSGAGFFGQGVRLDSIKRQYDAFLNQQVLSASARKEEYAAYNAQISQIDNLLADESAGLSPALSDFFRGVNDVANNPSSVPARQSLISLAESLAGRFNAMDSRIDEIRDLTEGQIASAVTEINGYAKQIAELNQRITEVEAAGPSVAANDLHDQRDALVAELNKLVKVSTYTESNGALSVFIGSGQSLVTGNKASQLAVAYPTAADPTRGAIQLVTPSGAVTLPESVFTSGKIGGLLSFRSQTLDRVRADLDTLAYEVGTQFNAQHRGGLTLDGDLGGDFFTGLTQVAGAAGAMQVAITDPRRVAAASAAAVGNAGTGAIRWAGNVAADFSMRFDAVNSQFEVFDSAGASQGFVAYDPATDAGGVTVSLPGSLSAVSLVLSGVPQDADAFAVGTAGAGDNRNALTLAGMQTSKLMNGGTATYQSAFSQLVSFVGNKAREVQIGEKAQDAQLQQATAAQQALSGVNLDEEAANLLRFQQAYQAAARVMSLAGTLFDEVLTIARG